MFEIYAMVYSMLIKCLNINLQNEGFASIQLFPWLPVKEITAESSIPWTGSPGKLAKASRLSDMSLVFFSDNFA